MVTIRYEEDRGEGEEGSDSEEWKLLADGRCLGCAYEKRTMAFSSFLWRLAQPQTPLNGIMKVLPSFVKEYSTATDFDPVARLVINPADSRLRSVFVSIRCEILPKPRRNSP